MSARRAPRARAPRPPRSLATKLGSVVLGFEALIVFLGGLVAYGLGSLPEAIPDWWGVVGGIALAIAMILTAGRVHTRAGVITGWILQALVVASAVVVPGMLFVALIFGGMWVFAQVQGPRIEARGRA